MTNYPQAACVGHDPELWFRLDKTLTDRDATKLAVAICSTCPVREACLAQALKDEGGVSVTGRHGIFGGLTPEQRAGTRRQASLLAPCGTPGAARRHRRRGEVVCGPCADSEAAYYQERKGRAAS